MDMKGLRRRSVRMLTALLLALAMIVTYMPALAFADDQPAGPAGDGDDQVVAVDQQEETDADAEDTIVEEPAEGSQAVSEPEEDSSKPEMHKSGLRIQSDPEPEPEEGSEEEGPFAVILDVENDDNILINDWFYYKAEAVGEGSDDVDYIEVYSDYDEAKDDPDEWGMKRRCDGNYIDANMQRMWYEEGGEHSFAAAAWTYGEDGAQMVGEVAVYPVTVAEPSGDIGAFSITGLKVNDAPKDSFDVEGAPVEITRGDKLDITCEKATDATHYWVDAQIYNSDEERWEYYQHYSDTRDPSLYLNTIELREGTYKLSVGANSPGFKTVNASNDIYLNVENKTVPESGIYFEVSAGTESAHPIDTCQEIEYEVYCPGAHKVVVYPTWPSPWWHLERWDADSMYDTASYDNSGTYTLRAVAYVDDDEDGDTPDVEITSEKKVYVKASKGSKLSINMPELPSYIVAGDDDDLEFSVPVPDNAEGVGAIVRFDREDYQGNDELFHGEAYADDHEALNVSFNKGALEADDTVLVELDTWGPGYEAARVMARIPVIESDTDDDVMLSVDVDDNEVLVNERFNVTVRSADKEIEEVQLFDGYGYCDYEEPDDDGGFITDLSFGEAGVYSLLAKVWFEDEEDCVITNVVTITAKSNGRVGPFDIGSMKINMEDCDWDETSESDPLPVTRGDDISIKCGESKNADHYWVDVDKYNEPDTEEGEEEGWWDDNWDNFGHGDDKEFTFNTIGFEPGLYRIRAKANAQGLESEEAPTQVYVKVSDPDIPEGGMLFIVPGAVTDPKTGEQTLSLKTCQEGSFTAYCPDADWIEVLYDAENDPDWNDDNDGGDFWDSSFSYRNSGTYLLKAVAYESDDEEYEDDVEDEDYKEDEEDDEEDSYHEIASAEVTVNVAASEGSYALEMPELPSYIREGKDNVEFTLKLPKEEKGLFPKPAEGVHVNVCWEYDGDDQEIIDMREEDDFRDDLYDRELKPEDFTGGVLTDSFDTSELPEDSIIRMRVEAWGVDHEQIVKESGFPVVGQPSDKVNITASTTETPVNADVIFTIKTADGSNIDSVRFFDGENLQWEEEPDEANPTKFVRYQSFGQAGQYAVFAKVKLEGSDEWLTTPLVVVTAASKGSVGDFSISKLYVDGAEQEGTSNLEVERGQIISIEHSASSHAEHFWVDIDAFRQDDDGNWDWEWYDHKADVYSADAPLTLATAELEPGDYKLYVKADAENYETAEAEVINLKVTESSIPDDTISFAVPGAVTDPQSGDTTLALQAGESYTFSAYCPNAWYIRVFRDYHSEGDNDWCSDNLDYDWEKGQYYANPGFSENEMYDSHGKYTLMAVAYDKPTGIPGTDSFKGGNIIATSEIEVTVTSSGSLDVKIPDELPSEVCAGGNGFSFTAEKPAHAEGIRVAVWYENDPETGDDNAVIYDCAGNKDLEVNISADDLFEGETLTVAINAWGTGYDSDHESADIKVLSHKLTAHAAKAATCRETGNIAYWSCDRCGKLFRDKDGRNEVKDISTPVNPNAHSWVQGAESYDLTKSPDYYVTARTDTCSNCHVKRLVTLGNTAYKKGLPKAKISKPIAGKKKVTVKWNKVVKKDKNKIAGFEIQIRGNGIDKVVTAGKSKSSKVVNGLEAKKKYKVRVRTYKGKGTAKQVSVWSGWKSVKTK